MRSAKWLETIQLVTACKGLDGSLDKIRATASQTSAVARVALRYKHSFNPTYNHLWPLQLIFNIAEVPSLVWKRQRSHQGHLTYARLYISDVSHSLKQLHIWFLWLEFRWSDLHQKRWVVKCDACGRLSFLMYMYNIWVKSFSVILHVCCTCCYGNLTF